MVRTWALAAALLVTLTTLGGRLAQAANYRFEVERNASVVTIQRDGSADIEYELRFRCLPGGDPIDIVDIGLPNREYRLETAQAELDGQQLSAIRPSTAVSCGVEIPLQQTITPGEAATLHFRINNPHMVYQDRADGDYAGIEFSPTWYGAAYTQGVTNLSVSILFPAGVTGDETRYHRERFDDARHIGERIAFTWRRPQASPSKQYMFGVSFPKRYVDVVYREGRWAALVNWLRRAISPALGVLLGLAALIAIILLLMRANEARKMDYMPPALSMEGSGVRRGLTAVEAAALLEQPLDRIAAMIVFGLANKGALRIQSFDPLVAEPTGAALGGTASEQTSSGTGEAAASGAVRVEAQHAVPQSETPSASAAELQPYEKAVLKAIGKQLSGNLPAERMQAIMADLVREVNDKLRGYNRRETAEYYRYIVSKAWLDVAAAQTPQDKADRWERNADWTMADPEYGKRMEDNFGREEQMPWRNRWWGWNAYDDYGPRYPLGARAETHPGNLPGREFADRLVSRIEHMARNLVPDRHALAQAVTDKTNPPTFVPELKQMLKDLQQSASEGGCVGGGCACACASCACACAGGGR